MDRGSPIGGRVGMGARPIGHRAPVTIGAGAPTGGLAPTHIGVRARSIGEPAAIRNRAGTIGVLYGVAASAKHVAGPAGARHLFADGRASPVIANDLRC